ncbi:MAG: hypothetical protein LUH58_02740 [Lachnospiraceae bacterium]|nr:hypothetical protein [Lachnospiraceae bacterium]
MQGRVFFREAAALILAAALSMAGLPASAAANSGIEAAALRTEEETEPSTKEAVQETAVETDTGEKPESGEDGQEESAESTEEEQEEDAGSSVEEQEESAGSGGEEQEEDAGSGGEEQEEDAGSSGEEQEESAGSGGEEQEESAEGAGNEREEREEDVEGEQEENMENEEGEQGENAENKEGEQGENAENRKDEQEENAGNTEDGQEETVESVKDSQEENEKSGENSPEEGAEGVDSAQEKNEAESPGEDSGNEEKGSEETGENGENIKEQDGSSTDESGESTGNHEDKILTADEETAEVILMEENVETVSGEEPETGGETGTSASAAAEDLCQLNLIVLAGDEITALEGAVFTIERQMTDAVSGENWWEYLEGDGTVFTNQEGNEAGAYTSDENGIISVEDLGCGTYRVTQVRTRAGFNLMTEALMVTLPLAGVSEEGTSEEDSAPEEAGILEGTAEENSEEGEIGMTAEMDVIKTAAVEGEYDLTETGGLYYYYEVTYTIVNTASLRLPYTGADTGTVWLTGFAGMLLLTAAWLMLCGWDRHSLPEIE